MRVLRPAIVLSLSALFLTPACGSGETGASPQRDATSSRGVLLITLAALRPDMISTYGGASPTPAIDGLAASGVTFTDAASVAPMSRPALAAVLTGLAPDRSGVRDDVADRLPATVQTVAEKLVGAGWITMGFVGSDTCGWGSGLERGFTQFDAPELLFVGPGRLVPKPRSAFDVTVNAAAWLAAQPAGKPVFAWVHLADLQALPFAEKEESKPADDYANGIVSVDKAVARLVDAAQARGMEIVLAGTHGTFLGENGRWGDSFWLEPQTLRVPLIWAGPRAVASHAKGSKDPRRASIQDVAATIAAIGGVTLDAASEGMDLSGAASDSRVRRAWSWAPDDQLAWPNLAVVDRGSGWKAAEPSDRPATRRPRALDAENRKRVLATGLKLGPASKDAERPANADDIVRRLGVVRRALSLRGLARARRQSSLLLKDAPSNLGALVARMFVVYGDAKNKETAALADTLLNLYPDRQEALHWVAHYEFEAAQPARAEALVVAAASVGPQDADLLYDMACARSLAGDVPSGLGYLKAAIEAGYRQWEWIDRDSDIAALRADPGYAALRQKPVR